MKIIKNLNHFKIIQSIGIAAAAAAVGVLIIQENPNKVLLCLLLGLVLAALGLSLSQGRLQKKIFLKLLDEKLITEEFLEAIRTKGMSVDPADYGCKNIKEEVLNNYELELLQNQTTVIMLQSQINPHFLYNTLDCIRGEAILVGASELASMTKALSNFFSYSISKSGVLVTIREELESIENYFLIQQFRFNKRFRLTIHCDRDETELMENVIPRLALQPIIENSISHGFRSIVSDCELSVSIFKTDQAVLIRCSDNGCGMSAKEQEEITASLEKCVDSAEEKVGKHSTHGIGLVNINRRIKLLFGNEYGLYISSLENAGTDVNIRLPLQSTGIE